MAKPRQYCQCLGKRHVSVRLDHNGQSTMPVPPREIFGVGEENEEAGKGIGIK